MTNASKWRDDRSGKVRSPEVTGHTAYLGQPSSNRQLRVYDKRLESGGATPAIRWELEYRKKQAECLALTLGKVEVQDWAEVFSTALLSFVDFRDRNSHSEVEKRQRLPWYARLVGLAKRSRAALSQPARTVKDTLDWIERAVAPSLAVVVEAFGGNLDLLKEIVDRGRDRWRPKHRALLADLGP